MLPKLGLYEGNWNGKWEAWRCGNRLQRCDGANVGRERGWERRKEGSALVTLIHSSKHNFF